MVRQEGKVPPFSAAQLIIITLNSHIQACLEKTFYLECHIWGTLRWSSHPFLSIIHLADYYEGGPHERIGKCHLNKRSPKEERL